MTKKSSKENLRQVRQEKKVKPRIELVESSFADYDNLLIDTCALAYFEFTNLVEKAKHVTFIYSTIEEMDNNKRKIVQHY